jgi:hypothetical protein
MKAGSPFTLLLPAGFAGGCVFVSVFGLGCRLVEANFTSGEKRLVDFVHFCLFRRFLALVGLAVLRRLDPLI